MTSISLYVKFYLTIKRTHKYKEKGMIKMTEETDESRLDFGIIGERIKQKRREKGITQEILAEKMDLSIAYLSRVERGEANINLKRLVQISELLDINVSELITGTTTGTEIYLDREMKNVLSGCTPEKQKLIYNIAKIIAGIDFKK